jgi:hypothetical protein
MNDHFVGNNFLTRHFDSFTQHMHNTNVGKNMNYDLDKLTGRKLCLDSMEYICDESRCGWLPRQNVSRWVTVSKRKLPLQAL